MSVYRNIKYYFPSEKKKVFSFNLLHDHWYFFLMVSKQEKRALERRLSEMEEEVKVWKNLLPLFIPFCAFC